MDGGEVGADRRTVVFDLDGTLVAGNSYRLFVRHLLLKHPARRTLVLLTVPVWAPLMLLPRTRARTERYLLWLSCVGMDPSSFAAAARDFAVSHAGPTGGRVATAGLARLRAHLSQGDRVIVATGCGAPLAQEVCRVLGLDGLDVVSSTVSRGRWSLSTHVVPALGEGKVRALEAAGVRFPVDHAYSDSAEDLPLLRGARVAHVVDPTPRDWRRLRRDLGADVDLLRWAKPRGAATANRTPRRAG